MTDTLNHTSGTNLSAQQPQSNPTHDGSVTSTHNNTTSRCSGCGSPSTLKCPTCIKLNMPHIHSFCTQQCFKSHWKLHNLLHKEFTYTPPIFNYTGPLRPAYITPQQTVPSHINQPDYALTSVPSTELQLRGDRTIPLYNNNDIAGIREACRIGRIVLDAAHSIIRPGITTDDIDQIVYYTTIKHNAYPSPLNYHGFPKSCCTSVNEVICHGIPDKRPLQSGDIVNVDISVYYNGYHGDLNETFVVGDVDDESKQLIKVTYDSLFAAIQHVKPGMFYREIGDIIYNYLQSNDKKYGIVRSYCGHGIGTLFHCMPNIPHYHKNKAIGVAQAGHIFTIEPMINQGTYNDVLWKFDNWTSTTADGKRSAQFEHTLLVTDDGCEILTARTADSPALWWEIDQ